MIKISRTQVAGKEHVCDECGLAIHKGQPYDRVAQFESWESLGLKETDAIFTDEPAKELWEILRDTRRMAEVLIVKVHNHGADCAA